MASKTRAHTGATVVAVQNINNPLFMVLSVDNHSVGWIDHVRELNVKIIRDFVVGLPISDGTNLALEVKEKPAIEGLLDEGNVFGDVDMCAGGIEKQGVGVTVVTGSDGVGRD